MQFFIRQVLVVAQSLSHVWLFATPWIAAHQASLSFTISQSLRKLMATESVMLPNYLNFCHDLSSFSQSFAASRSSPVSWKQVFTENLLSVISYARIQVKPEK